MRRFLSLALVVSIVLTLATAAADGPAGDRPTPDLERLDRLMQGLETLGFSGAIIAGHPDNPGLVAAYGLADREAGKPYEPATVQTMGSITKPFTGALVMALEAQGKLGTDDTLSQYFDDVPPGKRDITIHQLLTHSAGFAGALGPDNEPVEPNAFARLALATPLDFEPGSDYSYSNVGYSLLGIIVEKVTGKSFETALRETLLEPLGMKDTGYLAPGWDKKRLATGYRDGQRWGQVHQRGWASDGPGWHLRANGGLHTTVGDMQQFARLLNGHGPLSAEAVARWTEPRVDEGGGDTFYGYGWVTTDSELGKLVTHNGGNGIFSADFLWFPEAGFFLYVQGNSATIPAADIQELMMAALLDPGFSMPPVLSPAPGTSAADSAAHAGEFVTEGGRVVLAADHDRLLANVTGQALLPVLANVPVDEREKLAGLHAQARAILDGLAEGRENVLRDVVTENSAERSQRLAELFDQIPDGTDITLVGTLPNPAGTRFHELAPYTSYVRIEAPFGTQVASFLWLEDGQYRGTALGPGSDLPGFTLVATAKDRYQAVQQAPPWQVFEVGFQGDCLVIKEARACRQ